LGGQPFANVKIWCGKNATEENTMKKLPGALIAMAVLTYLVGGFGVPAASSEARNGFGFNSTDIAGFPTGRVILTGGGAFVPGTTFGQSGGAFRCTESVLQDKAYAGTLQDCWPLPP